LQAAHIFSKAESQRPVMLLLARGTAYFGFISELLRKGLFTPEQVNASAGMSDRFTT